MGSIVAWIAQGAMPNPPDTAISNSPVNAFFIIFPIFVVFVLYSVQKLCVDKKFSELNRLWFDLTPFYYFLFYGINALAIGIAMVAWYISMQTGVTTGAVVASIFLLGSFLFLIVSMVSIIWPNKEFCWRYIFFANSIAAMSMFILTWVMSYINMRAAMFVGFGTFLLVVLLIIYIHLWNLDTRSPSENCTDLRFGRGYYYKVACPIKVCPPAPPLPPICENKHNSDSRHESPSSHRYSSSHRNSSSSHRDVSSSSHSSSSSNRKSKKSPSHKIEPTSRSSRSSSSNTQRNRAETGRRGYKYPQGSN